MKKIIFFIILSLFLIGCTSETPEKEMMDKNDMMEEAEMVEKSEMMEKAIEEKTEEEPKTTDWKNTVLKDVLIEEEFKISDFKGKPILLESFAVWCPKCKQQQDIIKDLHEDVGDSVISISINTDPNEDENKVIGHAEKYRYDWYFVVSPVKVTEALIDEFGISVVNAPGAPVVLICPDQSAKLLGRGVKSVEKLKEEIEDC